jgi:hypothetical protein
VAKKIYAQSKGGRQHRKTTNIMFYVVKGKIQNQTISLEYISTKKIIVDPLTKSLPPSVLREHLADMGLRESL